MLLDSIMTWGREKGGCCGSGSCSAQSQGWQEVSAGVRVFGVEPPWLKRM
jgi:hypothetical protein